MGMFDTVHVPCRCGADIELQSKAGDRYLRDYTVETAPLPILADVAEDTVKDGGVRCRKCGARFTISIQYIARIDWGEHKAVPYRNWPEDVEEEDANGG